MALREGAALAILPGEAHAMALGHEAAESQRLAHGPVDAGAGLDHLATVIEEALDGLVDVEPIRTLEMA